MARLTRSPERRGDLDQFVELALRAARRPVVDRRFLRLEQHGEVDLHVLDLPDTVKPHLQSGKSVRRWLVVVRDALLGVNRPGFAGGSVS